MSRWRIFSIGKTDVCLHPGMLLYAVYAMITGHGLFLVVATISILLHEAAHALTAAAFKQMPSSVELTPLGAVMRLEDENRLSFGKRLLMLFSGPAATLLLCYVAIRLAETQCSTVQLSRMLFMSNLSILLMNLLPVLPLDGGRIVSLVLGVFWPPRIVSQIMRCIGSVVGVGLIVLNVYASWKLGGWNLSLAFAGCCMLYTSSVATTSQAIAELKLFMDRKILLERKGCVKGIHIFALHSQTLRKLARILPPRNMASFVCIEAGSMKTLGWLSEADFVQLYLNHPDISLKEAINLCQNKQNYAKSDTI